MRARRLRASRARWRLTGPRAARYDAAALSLLAAWIHALVAPEHLAEWWVYGWFFIAAAAGQALCAVLLLVRPRPWLLVSAVAGNMAILAMYAVSRSRGVPLGPLRGVVEDVATIDLIALLAEAGLVVLLCTLLAPASRRRTVNAVCLGGLALWGSRVLGLLG